MTALAVTRHGEIRMSQRGIRDTDLEVVLDLGTEIGRDRIMLLKRDAAREIGLLKKQIANIERLSGKVLVVSEGHLVTTYHQAIPLRTCVRRSRRSGSRYPVNEG